MPVLTRSRRLVILQEWRLRKAAIDRQWTKVRELVKQGVNGLASNPEDPSPFDCEGGTAFSIAAKCEEDTTGIMQLLLSQGTPEDDDLLDITLSSMFFRSQTIKNAWPATERAYTHVNNILFLIGKGARISKYDWFSYVLFCKDFKALELLFSFPNLITDINIRSMTAEFGDTALLDLISYRPYRLLDSMELMLTHNADPNARSTDGCCHTPLMRIFVQAFDTPGGSGPFHREDLTSARDLLLRHGADVHIKDCYGNNMSFYVLDWIVCIHSDENIYYGETVRDMLQFLFSHHIDVLCRNEFGLSCIQHALRAIREFTWIEDREDIGVHLRFAIEQTLLYAVRSGFSGDLETFVQPQSPEGLEYYCLTHGLNTDRSWSFRGGIKNNVAYCASFGEMLTGVKQYQEQYQVLL
jgi:hypothetical protein